MVITTLTVLSLFFGVGGAGGHTSMMELLAQTAPLIEKYVEDEARETQALQALEHSRTRLTELGTKLSGHQQELVVLDRSFDTTREEFLAAFARINAAWDEAEREVLRGQLELREHITEEEWTQIYADLRKKLK